LSGQPEQQKIKKKQLSFIKSFMGL